MREDACISKVRLAGRLDDGDDDYTDAVIRTELIATLRQVFGEKVTEARAGMWLKRQLIDVTSGRLRYRMPHRALPGLEAVEIYDTQYTYLVHYTIEGDVVIFDTQPSTNTQVRWSYYLRPSTLQQYQTAGAVTAVDTTVLTVTVNSLPTDRVTAVSIATGDYLDIVHPNGSHELSLVNTTSTISGTTLTFATGVDLTDVEVGDFVRAADQTDWPCLHQEYHDCLCVMTAARIHRAKGNEGKAQALEAEAAGDMMRFANQLEPRMKDGQASCVPAYSMVRGRGRRFIPRTFPGT